MREPSPLNDLFTGADIRLVVADMDGTFLDADHAVPDGSAELIDELTAAGIMFAPASGRQYYRLLDMFSSHEEGMPFIAENGTYLALDGSEIGSWTVAPDTVAGVIETVAELATSRDVGLVLCGKESAYTARSDDAFLTEARKYYARLTVVDELSSITDEALKMAAYDFGDAETVLYPELQRFSAAHQVVLSGRHWVDIMNPESNKGMATRILQNHLRIGPDNTIAFGDFLNDLEMMREATFSFAMANAHPDIVAAARYIAPPNIEGGVQYVLRSLLRQQRPCSRTSPHEE